MNTGHYLMLPPTLPRFKVKPGSLHYAASARVRERRKILAAPVGMTEKKEPERARGVFARVTPRCQPGLKPSEE